MWIYEYLGIYVLKHTKGVIGTNVEENKENTE